MAIIRLSCPSENIEITGRVKVVKRGFATGPDAEQAAIDEALAKADRDAQNAMRKCRCKGTCSISFRQPRIRIRASGSQNNPAYPIVGAAIAVWTIFPRCKKPALPLRPPPPAVQPQTPAQPIGPQHQVTEPVTTPEIPVSTGSPYPFTKQLPCGTVKVSITGNGAIAFEFTPQPSELCDCASFGWIQHVKRNNIGWRYDNGAFHLYPSGTGIGDLSDPDAPVQPTGNTGKQNPWYGASSDPNDPTPPQDFAQNPKPQLKIGDHPGETLTSFVTQLVCIATGKVLFSWYWGPVLDGSLPLDQVPGGPTKQ